MAFKEIDSSGFPTRKQRGAPSVTIRENGQLALSAALADIVKGCPKVYVRVDYEGRQVQMQGIDSVPTGKEKSCLNVAWPKKGVGCTISAAGLMKQYFQDYDYKASGNQTVTDVKSSDAKKVFQFSVPKGTLKPKPKVARKARVKKPAGSTTAAAAPAAAPVAPEAVDTDIEL